MVLRQRIGLLTTLVAAAAACGSTPTDGGPSQASGEVATWLGGHRRVAESLVWDAGDGQGAQPYASWSTSDKAALERAVADAKSGAGPALADPPTNLVANLLGPDAPAVTVLSAGDARGLYFAHVGRSLMLEITHALPWSIADYTPAELEVLLDSRAFFLWKRNVAGTQVSGYAVYDDAATSIAPNTPTSALGFVIPAPPKVTAQFLAANSIVGADRITTINRLLEWSHVNLKHFGGGFDMAGTFFHWQYRGAPPVSRILAGTTLNAPPQATGHWTVGCPGTNWFLMAMLRTVNIPVRYVVVEEHATPYFPTEAKYLSHGDDPYNAYWSPSTPRIPASELLIGAATYDVWFAPTLTPAQRLANVGRQTKELGIKYLSDALLRRRCADIAAGVTSHAQSSVYADLRGIYTVAELETMDLWTKIDAKLVSVGGCSKVA